MPTNYLNASGTIVPENNPLFSIENRGFRYGDGVFETMLYKSGEIRFLELHVRRLQDSLRMIQIEDYTLYDSFFIKAKVEELLRKNNLVGKMARVRLIVYRDGGGIYSPETNKSKYVLQVHQIADVDDKKLGLIVGLYTEYKKPYSDLSKLKSLNSLIYVLAGHYKAKFSYDDVLILNQRGNLCESLVSNIFVYYEKNLYTPALTEGCIEGVMRKVVIDIAKSEGIEVIEAEISPEIMAVADEIFCTNAVQGIRWVMGYKQKRYFNKISRILQERLESWKH